jgi:hypothetical protein
MQQKHVQCYVNGMLITNSLKSEQYLGEEKCHTISIISKHFVLCPKTYPCGHHFRVVQCKSVDV